MTYAWITRLVRWLLIRDDLRRNARTKNELDQIIIPPEEVRYTFFLLRYPKSGYRESLLWAWLKYQPVERAYNWHDDLACGLALAASLPVGLFIGYWGGERAVWWLGLSVLACTGIVCGQFVLEVRTEWRERWTKRLRRRRSCQFQLDPRVPVLEQARSMLEQWNGRLAASSPRLTAVEVQQVAKVRREFVELLADLDVALTAYALGQGYRTSQQSNLLAEARQFTARLQVLQSKIPARS